MKQLACLTLLIFTSAGAAAERKNELPAEARAILEKAGQFDLLSLNPSRPEKEPAEKVEMFHGWKVLGQTPLKDAEVRKGVLTALLTGIAENDGSVAACFNPRHGLRASHDKKTVELVICFECLQIEVYVDGKKTAILTSESPQPGLDKLLREAKVPLPPQREK